jgi:molybdate transport system regulatory protein
MPSRKAPVAGLVELKPTSNATGYQSVRRNIIAARLRTKTWLELDGQFVIGDGGLKLLLAIIERGSLLAAARDIGWSYRHAWGYLRQAEAVLGASLTVSRPGRGPARGTLLTEAGRLVLEKLLAIRNRLDDALGATGPTSGEVAAKGTATRPARNPDKEAFDGR